MHMRGYIQLLTAASALSVACAGGTPPPPAPMPAAMTRPKVKTAAEFAKDAEHALAAGEHAAAVKAYDMVLERDPGNADALYNRAFALHRHGDLDAAEIGYRKTLEKDPSSTDAAVNLTEILREKGDTDGAIKVAKAGLEADPFHGKLLNNLSVLHRSRGEHAEAVEAVRKLLMRDKNNVDAYKNLSLVYYDQKKYTLARTILDNAQKMAKEQGREDADIFVNMGMIYLAKSENGKAMAAFKRAKEIDADHPVANYNIGALALGHRDYGLAAKSYEAVSQAWKDNFDVTVGHGYALQGQGKLDEAAATLEKARALLVKLPSPRPEEEREIVQQLMIINQNASKPQDALRYAEQYMALVGKRCSEDDYEGFCGRYNGINLMIQMAADAAPPPEETRQRKDASESSIFTDEEPPAEEVSDGAEAEENAP